MARSIEFTVATSMKNPYPLPTHVELEDDIGLTYWREHFGVTTEQLSEAVRAVGGDPAAVREHLLNQGGSAGVG